MPASFVSTAYSHRRNTPFTSPEYALCARRAVTWFLPPFSLARRSLYARPIARYPLISLGIVQRRPRLGFLLHQVLRLRHFPTLRPHLAGRIRATEDDGGIALMLARVRRSP